MKKLLILLLAVVAVLVCFFIFNKDKITGDKSANEANITLFRESGEVYYNAAGLSAQQVLNENKTEVNITSGTEVRTQDGTGYIIFPDNSMLSIDTNTSITVTYTPQKVFIFQTLGNTYHRVKSLESGQAYEVETPGTLAAVRGTKFAVMLDAESTDVKVTESKVSVTNTETQKEEMVEEGTQINTKDMKKSQMTEQDFRDGDWIEKNEILNDIINDPATRRESLRQLLQRGSGNTSLNTLRQLVRDIKNNTNTRQDTSNTETTDTNTNRNDQNNDRDTNNTNNEPKREEAENDTPATKPPETPVMPQLDALLDLWKSYGDNIDALYQYGFPSSPEIACQYMGGMTSVQLSAQLRLFESETGVSIPNKSAIIEFFEAIELYCRSGTDPNIQG